MGNQQTQEVTQQTIPNGLWAEELPQDIQAMFEAQTATTTDTTTVVEPTIVDTPPPVQNVEPPIQQAVQPTVQTPPEEDYEVIRFKKGDEYQKFFEALKSEDKTALREYVNLAFTDYNSFSDEEILRTEFYEEYSYLSNEEKKDLWEYTKEQKYGLVGDEMADRMTGLRMKADAQKVRNVKEQGKSNYKFPTFAEPQTTQVDPAVVERQRKLQESISNDPYLAEFEKTKSIKIGEGENAYNYEVGDSVRLREIVLTNPNLIIEPFLKRGANGEVEGVDMVGLSELAAFAYHKNKILKSYFDHAYKLGEKNFVDKELRHVPTTGNQTPPPAQQRNSID